MLENSQNTVKFATVLQQSPFYSDVRERYFLNTCGTCVILCTSCLLPLFLEPDWVQSSSPQSCATNRNRITVFRFSACLVPLESYILVEFFEICCDKPLFLLRYFSELFTSLLSHIALVISFIYLKALEYNYLPN